MKHFLLWAAGTLAMTAVALVVIRRIPVINDAAGLNPPQ